jgi:hypothetical protein
MQAGHEVVARGVAEVRPLGGMLADAALPQLAAGLQRARERVVVDVCRHPKDAARPVRQPVLERRRRRHRP